MTSPKVAVLLAALFLSPAPLLGAVSPTRQPDVAARPAAWTGPVITVSGSGEVERKPDYAVVTVGVQMRQQSARAASEAAGGAMKKVGEALRALELPGLQLQTSGVMLNPAYSWRNDGNEQQQVLLGYDATSTLRVRVEDPSKIGAIIDAAIDAGANRIHGISFELKGALEARSEALTLAAGAARQKADTLATALGLRITGVLTATTSGDSAPPWQPMANRAEFAQAATGMGESVETGMVSVRAETTVTFSAEPVR